MPESALKKPDVTYGKFHTGLFFCFAMLLSPELHSADKAICGVTELPNGKTVKNCMQAQWSPPTSNLSVPGSVITGNQITVSWTSSGAYQCTLTYPGNSVVGTSNAGIQVAINADTTFNLQCEGPGGSATPVSKTVVANPSFTANLKINGLNGDQSFDACYKDLTLFWDTSGGTGTVSCTLTPSPLLSPTPYPTPTPAAPPWTGATGNITTYSLQLDHAATTTTTFTLSCSDSGGHSDTDVANVTLNRKWPTDGHMTFLTKQTYSGSLGGLAGADAKCQTEADASGIRPGAIWRAVLNTTILAPTRITLSGPVYTPAILQRDEQDGSLQLCSAPYRARFVANGCGAMLSPDKTVFWSGSWGSYYYRIAQISVGTKTGTLCSRHTHFSNSQGNPSNSGEIGENLADESGHTVHPWRGMANGGSSSSTGSNCSNWTSSSGLGNSGKFVGNTTPWSDSGDTTHSCAKLLPLQCISQ